MTTYVNNLNSDIFVPKSVGSSLVTRRIIRGSSIALSVETSNADTHTVCICASKQGRHQHSRWASTVALFMTNSLELPDSGPSNSKHQVTLF